MNSGVVNQYADGQGPEQRFGSSCPGYLNTNIFQGTAQTSRDAWSAIKMGLDDHSTRPNLLDTSATHVGLGLATKQTPSGLLYCWVQIFTKKEKCNPDDQKKDPNLTDLFAPPKVDSTVEKPPGPKNDTPPPPPPNQTPPSAPPAEAAPMGPPPMALPVAPVILMPVAPPSPQPPPPAPKPEPVRPSEIPPYLPPNRPRAVSQPQFRSQPPELNENPKPKEVLAPPPPPKPQTPQPPALPVIPMGCPCGPPVNQQQQAPQPMAQAPLANQQQLMAQAPSLSQPQPMAQPPPQAAPMQGVPSSQPGPTQVKQVDKINMDTQVGVDDNPTAGGGEKSSPGPDPYGTAGYTADQPLRFNRGARPSPV